MECPILTSIFFNRTLDFAYCCKIVVLFSAMVEKCLRIVILCLLFCFITSSRVIGLSKGFFIASPLEPLSRFI